MTTAYYPSELASRILLDSDRSSLSAADNGDVTGLDRATKIIVAVVLGYDGKDTTASAYKLQWRNETVNPGGAFSDVASTGEIRFGTSATLVDGNAVDDAAPDDRRCSAQAGMTWQDGLENVGDNLCPDSGTFDLASDCYTEFQWAIDLSYARRGHQYTFQMYNNTAGAAVTNSPCDAQVTTLGLSLKMENAAVVVTRQDARLQRNPSMSVTGQAALQRATRLLVCAGGSVAISGQASLLALSYNFKSDHAAITIEFKDATFPYTPTETATVPLFTMSGDDKWVNSADDFWFRIAYLTANQSSLSITGQASSLNHTRSLRTEQGSISTAGQTAQLKRDRALKAEQGLFTVTLQDAALTYTGTKELIGEQGSAAISGQEALLFWHRVLKAQQTAIAVSFQPARLKAEKRHVAEQGSVSVTLHAADLRWSQELLAEQGSVAIALQDATLTYTSTGKLTAEHGSVATTLQDALALWHQLLKAEQASVGMTAQAAALASQKTFKAESGSVAITTQTANLDWNHALKAEQSAVNSVFEEAAFTHVSMGKITAGHGTISLAMQDASFTVVLVPVVPVAAPVSAGYAWQISAVPAEKSAVVAVDGVEAITDLQDAAVLISTAAKAGRIKARAVAGGPVAASTVSRAVVYDLTARADTNAGRVQAVSEEDTEEFLRTVSHILDLAA